MHTTMPAVRHNALMSVRRALVSGLAALLASSLTACSGDDPNAAAIGDVLPAHADDQFQSNQRVVEVALPTGRLQIWTSKPTRDVAAEDTLDLAPVSAPSGATFVPISWRSVVDFRAAQPYLTTSAVPQIDLIADGTGYRLPSPASSERGESFYVLVDGDAETLSMTITFEGVTQTVDLDKGEVDAGRARPLYRLTAKRTPRLSCDGQWEAANEGEAMAHTCEVSEALLLPFADGRWAEPGHRWLVVTLRTEVGLYGIGTPTGGGGQYAVRRSRLRASLDGEPPVATVDDKTTTEVCPDPLDGTCTTELALIFDVRANEIPRRFDAEQNITFDLVRKWGDFDGDERFSFDTDSPVRLTFAE